MDAVEFIREEIRMCASCRDCIDCPLSNTAYCSVSPKKRSQEEAEEIVRRVKEWSTTHPRKTRQSMLLGQWPNTAKDRGGIVNFCPKYIDVNFSCVVESGGERWLKKCDDCRHKFWMQEVE